MKIKELPLVVTAQFLSNLPEQFSIDQFLIDEKKFRSVVWEISDKKFPLHHLCSGLMDVYIFQVVRDMETRPALRMITEEG